MSKIRQFAGLVGWALDEQLIEFRRARPISGKLRAKGPRQALGMITVR